MAQRLPVVTIETHKARLTDGGVEETVMHDPPVKVRRIGHKLCGRVDVNEPIPIQGQVTIEPVFLADGYGAVKLIYLDYLVVILTHLDSRTPAPAVGRVCRDVDIVIIKGLSQCPVAVDIQHLDEPIGIIGSTAKVRCCPGCRVSRIRILVDRRLTLPDVQPVVVNLCPSDRGGVYLLQTPVVAGLIQLPYGPVGKGQEVCTHHQHPGMGCIGNRSPW